MAAPSSDRGVDDVLTLSGRRAATHWLFKHSGGLHRVPVPDTGLFDDEGVLEAWISSSASKNHHHEATTCEVVRRDFLETNVMRLEAHLQDLASERQSKIVAVQQDDELTCLDEVRLDALVRELCAREIAMNAAEPDPRIPRAFPGGGAFCLQEFVPPRNDQLLVVHFQHEASTPESAFGGGNADIDVGRSGTTHDSPPSPSRHRLNRLEGRCSLTTRVWPRAQSVLRASAADLSAEAATKTLEPLHARVEALVQELVIHLHVFFGLRLLDATLELVRESPQPHHDTLFLVSAQRIVVQRVSALPPPTTETSHLPGRSGSPRRQRKLKPKQRKASSAMMNQSESLDAETNTLTVAPRTNVRMCRQCRSNQDIALAQELEHRQRTLRRVLSNYQSAQEQCTAAQQRESDAQTQLARQQQTIAELQHKLDRMRTELAARNAQTQQLMSSNAALQMDKEAAADSVHTAELHAQAIEQRLAQVMHAAQVAVVHHESDVTQRLQSAERQSTELLAHVQQLQVELERSQLTLRKLQTAFEQVLADRDELRFQWRFVCRKLTDVHDSGVAPPPRIAGGYMPYPAPSDANVRAVVKWLVDYNAKRAVVDSARRHQSAAKRLQLKFELMHVLGSPTKYRGTSTNRSPSTPSPQARHRRSRSPSKRSSLSLPPRRNLNSSSTSPHKRDNDGEAAVTLVAQAMSAQTSTARADEQR